jgi:ABC-2 type transport system permease protein
VAGIVISAPTLVSLRTLVSMRTAILRRQTAGKRAIGAWVLVALVTLLALGTLLAGLRHYHYPGAGANVVATLSLGWLLGWVTGPLLTGDDATLRLDYFKLLPIPARRLAYAMLGAAFANVSLVFSLIAFAALIALGTESGIAAALTGAAAAVLDLILAVVAAQVAIAVFGPAISSRRGRDFGTLVLALAITLLSLASGLVPLVAQRLTDGRSPVLSDVVRALPSGWGAVAVEAAGRSDWGLVTACLAALTGLIVALVLAWPPLLARRLTMSARGSRPARSGSRQAAHAPGRAARPLASRPTTPLGAVVGRELRLYSRSVLRSLLLMISFLVGAGVGVIAAASGKTDGLPFCGLLFTVIAAACFTNCYGDDGTSLWLTLVVPGAARADVHGRMWAWLLVVGPAGLALTLVLTAVSGQAWSWPWVLAAEPAMVIGCAGLLVLVGAWSVNGLAPDGGPSPARVLKTHVALIAIPVVVLFPAAALLISGVIIHSLLLRWLAVPVGIAWATLLSWRAASAATRRLESRGPEIFSAVRGAAAH